MQLNTRRHGFGIRWHLHLATLLMPAWAAEDDVRKVLRFLFASHTERSHMERTIRANFVPNPS
eukprot:6233710-Amphidinium_carterae.2